MNKIIKELKYREKGVAVWGLGYIGYSSMAYFAMSGIRCVGYDTLAEKIKFINKKGKLKHKGEKSFPNLDFWLGFDVEPMFRDGLIKATSKRRVLISNDFPVHLVAVPTEKENKFGEHLPYDKHLKDVFETMATYKKLKTIPRVVGGTNKKTTELMVDVLSLVCGTVLKADDHKQATIVKSIENSYRQVDITLANQLSVAYPDLNMKKILKLVGTKWNVGTFHPSFGTGGYCLPLAPHYVLSGCRNPEALTLLKNSVDFDYDQPRRVAKSLAKRGGKSCRHTGGCVCS